MGILWLVFKGLIKFGAWIMEPPDEWDGIDLGVDPPPYPEEPWGHYPGH